MIQQEVLKFPFGKPLECHAYIMNSVLISLKEYQTNQVDYGCQVN